MKISPSRPVLLEEKMTTKTFLDFDVVKVLAAIGLCDDDIEHWSLNNGKVTIAHIAAEYNKLPKDFHIRYSDLWELKNSKGETVKEVAILNGYRL
ncbi:MAG: hypothetical protein QXL94_07155 [Candidatus Parvarchaeum sp.]